MGKAYVVVEGHGETRAALNLITRVWADLSLPYMVWFDPPIRGHAPHAEEGIAKACSRERCADGDETTAARLVEMRAAPRYHPAASRPGARV